MSLPEETMLELMAYTDGELAGDDLARIEQLVRTNDEARRVVEAMGGLGDLVREAIDTRWIEQHAAPIAAAVMVKLDAEPTVVKKRSRESERVRQLPIGRRVGAVAVGVLAMAAAAFLFVRAQEAKNGAGPTASAQPTASQTVSPPQTLAQGSPTSSGSQAAPGTAGVDVEQVESPSHQVSVFYLPAADPAANSNASSVVVWIGE